MCSFSLPLPFQQKATINRTHLPSIAASGPLPSVSPICISHCTHIALSLLAHCLAIRRLIRPILSPPRPFVPSPLGLIAWTMPLKNDGRNFPPLKLLRPSIRPPPQVMDNLLFPVFIRITFSLIFN
ncbi:hypothetical protein niasHS_009920 [Heterodera schachtii]|uniref:Uncharacterized protein n=1 Tax=Heterodera schachtii TaxID=97005 RepID=A0ABD2JCX3_HETSC